MRTAVQKSRQLYDQVQFIIGDLAASSSSCWMLDPLLTNYQSERCLIAAGTHTTSRNKSRHISNRSRIWMKTCTKHDLPRNLVHAKDSDYVEIKYA